MKLCFLLLLFFFLAVVSFGQNVAPDSLDLVPVQQKFARSETKIDSIQTSFYQSTDSLKLAYRNRLTTIDSVDRIWQKRLDSLESSSFSSSTLATNTLDSIQSRWKTKIDSLTSLKSLTNKINKKLDSLKLLRDSTLSQLNKKVELLKAKTVGKITGLDLPEEVAGKVSDATSKINGFQLPASDLNVASLNTGSSHVPTMNNINLETPAGALNLPATSEIKGINGELSGVSGKVEDYSKDIHQLSKGNLNEVKALPGTAEAKAEELSGLNEIKDKTQPLDKYKEMSSGLRNPDSLKALAKQEVKEAAVNHFAGKEQQLKQAMDMIAKYKSKYHSINSITDITKRPPNEMKGKPFIERLVPGIGIQIQKKGGDVLVDFNPYAGYRFTGRITAGLGWNQRVAYNFDNGIFNAQAKIFGPRTFGEFKLWKGFSPRVEVEVMNTNVPPITRTPTVDPFQREWVWGAFVGVKKEYKFIKNVKGTALVMMRLFNPDHKSPYADVVNVRFGFEFPMKKKKV